MRLKMLGALAIAVTTFGTDASADNFDGAAPLICATVESFDCAPNSSCIKDSPESIALPRFIRLDFTAKTVVADRIGGGEPIKAEIATQQVQEGHLLLQGMQNGNAWSMAVTQATGDMSLSIVSHGVGFVVFGHCTGL